jgi:XTP/dITP diphosphohydrolase
MPESTEVWFATSNDHKFDEARLALRPFDVLLRRLHAKGGELQSDDIGVIARRAVAETYSRVRRPVFVEDTGLFVTSLRGFPGPYAAFVSRTIGPASLLTLMNRIGERDAEFVSVVAFCREPGEAFLFTGRLKGRISREMRGMGGFGFDPIFVPEGHKRTLAEMSMEEKCRISHRSIALRALGTWLESHRNG